MDIIDLDRYPPVTKGFILVSIFANLLCFLNVMKPMSLFLNFQLVLFNFQFWRLFTHVFFFGKIGIKALFYLFFFSRYSKALESFSFQGQWLDYFYLLLTGNSMMVLFKLFVPEASFLGPGITFMIVYIWAKKNALQQINLVNMLHIRGSNLPLVLMFSSWVLKQKTLKLDLMGIISGHLYYYLNDIFPRFNGGQLIIGNC